MKRRSNWIIPISTLFVLITMTTLLLVPSAMAETGNTGMIVNINTADAADLASLPGIGNSKAKAIVTYRSEHGPFSTVDELANVKGIGINLIEKIRDFIITQ
jgi:competence protein ComEA